ncbi:MAG: hypothetical protein HY272_01800 [Gammaproteobacteria bacterium]|nr:hypothetical protein [Gammaproteobacteria bacterium]
MAITPQNKRPRHYAAEIILMRTRAERAAALEKVPPEWLGLIEAHVRNHLARQRHRKAAA